MNAAAQAVVTPGCPRREAIRKATPGAPTREALQDLARLETPSMYRHALCGTREIPRSHVVVGRGGQHPLLASRVLVAPVLFEGTADSIGKSKDVCRRHANVGSRTAS